MVCEIILYCILKQLLYNGLHLPHSFKYTHDVTGKKILKSSPLTHHELFKDILSHETKQNLKEIFCSSNTFIKYLLSPRQFTLFLSAKDTLIKMLLRF